MYEWCRPTQGLRTLSRSHPAASAHGRPVRCLIIIVLCTMIVALNEIYRAMVMQQRVNGEMPEGLWTCRSGITPLPQSMADGSNRNR